MISAIIQARCNSKRLPNKIMLPLMGKTVLERIIDRVRKSKVDNIIVATTDRADDDCVVELCVENNILFYRGSENDVLGRYYQAACQSGSEVIVRVTADDPLKDPKIINRAIDILLDGKYDYVSNTIKPTFPEGIDIEVFTMESLKKAHLNAKLPSEREHVTPYIWKNKDVKGFRVKNFENDVDLSQMRWTLDNKFDYEFMKEIYQYFFYHKKPMFYMEDILILLSEKPELLNLNKGYIRNEGYIRSVVEENSF